MNRINPLRTNDAITLHYTCDFFIINSHYRILVNSCWDCEKDIFQIFHRCLNKFNNYSTVI